MDLKERLVAVIDPLVSGLGYEVVLLEFNAAAHQGLLRVFIDSPAGVGLTDCERVSREISALLDVENLMTTAYRLEISSPGFDRPLVKAEHFERFRGETVRLQTFAPVGGKRRFRGILQGMEGDAVVVEVGADRVRLPLAEIEKARVVPVYEQETKAK